MSDIPGEHIQRLFNQLEEKGIAVSYIKIVAAIVGHSSPAMTMDLYSHVPPTTKADEMESISKVFAG